MRSLILTTKITGGAGKACYRIHQGFKNINHDNQVLTSVGTDKYKSSSVHTSVTPYNKLYNFRHDIFLKLHNIEAYEPLRTPYDITRSQVYLDSDIINIHWTSRFLDYLKFFPKNKKPIVYTLHDMQAFSGGYAYSSDNKKGYLKNVYKNNRFAKMRLLKNQNITIVSPSNWLMGESQKSDLFKNYDHHCIRNGLDTSIFTYGSKREARRALHLPQNIKIILFVAQSLKNKRKGFKMLLELGQKANFEETMLLAIGDLKSKKTGRIKSTGYIADENILANYYKAADLFVIPSKADNLPNTIVESLCCGTPVLGFSVGGIPEMVQHKKNGLLLGSYNWSSLKEGVSFAVNYNWDHKLISKNAAKLYDQNTQASKYLNLFQSVIRKDE